MAYNTMILYRILQRQFKFESKLLIYLKQRQITPFLHRQWISEDDPYETRRFKNNYPCDRLGGTTDGSKTLGTMAAAQQQLSVSILSVALHMWKKMRMIRYEK